MFYEYEVSWYNSFTDKDCTDKGIVSAKTYGEAAERVADEYGTDTINYIHLIDMCIEGEYCISYDELKQLFESKPQEGDAG